jgi:hypothetical protein
MDVFGMVTDRMFDGAESTWNRVRRVIGANVLRL